MEGLSARGRNWLQCRQSLLRTKGGIIRSSPRAGGKGATRVIPSQGNRRYADGTKKIRLGGILSRSILSLCKVHNGAERTSEGTP